MFFRKISIVLFAVLWMFPQISFAQAIDSFSVTATPEYPKEFSQTTLRLESFSTDLDRAKITWKENGVVVAQDVGITEKVFTAPRNGSSKTISIEVLTQSGYKLTSQYILAPQAIDLLWEAPDSYVPPFYKGKALVGEGGVVRIVALPNFTKNGVPIDRTQTVYTWTRNNTQPEGASGYGKSSFLFRLNPLKGNETIKVLAGTLSGDSKIEESLLIRPSQTKIIAYETSPLLGTVYGQAFTQGLNLTNDEITLVAEPYYFSGASDVRSSVIFNWSLDGGSVRTGSDPTRLTLQRPLHAGQTNVGISVSHVENIMQRAQNILKIIYGEK